MKKTVLTFIVCSLLTYVLSFACAFFGFIGPVFWVGIGVPAALLCAFPMVYLLGKNRIPGQMILTSIVFILISFAIGEIWKPLNAAVMLAAGVLGEGIIAVSDRNTMKGIRNGYCGFSAIFTASILPMWFYKAEYLAHASEEMNSAAYADGLSSLAAPAGLVILLAVVFVTGYLGAVLAEKVLAKKLDSDIYT